MNRLLAVSWEMPPMYGPRGVQVSRTLGHLAGRGWRPIVVCLSPRRGGPHWPNGHAADPPPGVDLVRVASPEEWMAVRVFWHLVPALRDYPDSTRVWIPTAGDRAIRVARAERCAGLITFAQPWSDHLIGLQVSGATGLPWVAHFSDPWADSPYATPRQRSIWRRMEEDVIRHARAVVFVTEETTDLVMAKYPAAWREKVAIVPHGFEPRAVTATQPVPSPPADRRGRPLRLVYTGRFYDGHRTPLPVFEALARLNATHPLADVIEVSFIGPGVTAFEPDARALGIEALIRFHDRVSPSEAAREAAAADVLLVIDRPSDGPSVFLPSKLVDYLAFRKPILGVTPVRGASARILRALGCAVAPVDDVDAVQSAIADLIRQYRDGSLRVGSSFDRVAAEFDITQTTERLHQVLLHAFDQPRGR